MVPHLPPSALAVTLASPRPSARANLCHLGIQSGSTKRSASAQEMSHAAASPLNESDRNPSIHKTMHVIILRSQSHRLSTNAIHRPIPWRDSRAGVHIAHPGLQLRMCRQFSGCRTMAVTSCPRSRASFKMADPTNPVAPINAIFALNLLLLYLLQLV